MPQCLTCGAYVPEQAGVCLDCGMDMHSAPPPPSPVADPLTPPPPAVTSMSAPGTAARLIIKRHGALTAEVFPLWDRVIVGRFDPDSGPVDIDLGPLPEAVYVSRHHAELWQDANGQWAIRDLGSGSGTFLRPQGEGAFQRVTGERTLQDSDEIALGNARFVFRLG